MKVSIFIAAGADKADYFLVAPLAKSLFATSVSSVISRKQC